MNIHLVSLTHVFVVKIGPGDLVSWARNMRKLLPFHWDHIVIFHFLFEGKKVMSNLLVASFKLKN